MSKVEDMAADVLTRIYNATFNETWKTTACQCSGYDTCASDWLCALFFPPFAMATARSNVDGSNCCWAALTSMPALNYNVVRRRYEIIGDDGEDAVYGTFCVPCAARQALTESQQRGRVRNWGPYLWEQSTQQREQWHLPLCSCTIETFCYALFLPQCLSAQARSRFDGSSCCLNFFCSTPCGNNSMIREGYGIQGNECIDGLTATFLYPCALQRMYTEATIRFLKAMAAAAANKMKGCCPCCK